MRILLGVFFIVLIITACSSTNEQEISQDVAQFIGECAESDVCAQLPIDPDKQMRVGEVEIIDEQSAKVHWQWEWGEELRQKYEITALYEGESWRPTKVELIEQVRLEKEIIEIPPEIEVQYDSNLFTGAAHVVQFGSNGKRLITKEITGVNSKSQSEKTVSEMITADPTNWIVTRGQLNEGRMKGDVTRLVRDYFLNYQAGNFAGLSELAPEAANYQYQAEFFLTDFEVKLAEDIKIWGDEGEPKRAEIEGSPITEPFTLSTQVPIKINYSLFGLEFNTSEKLQLTWGKENQKWTMPFWGVSRAVAMNETMGLGENIITLDGVATTHNQTLIALTVSRHLPTTISVEGYQQLDKLLLFKLPRAYKWVSQLPPPNQNELSIIIESVPAAPKTLKVDLSRSRTLDTASGVQGRVEWGPTCGNPSSEDADACGNIPYQAKLTVASEAGLVLINTTSDANGFYRIELPPGQYTLIPESSEFMPTNPIPFTVNPGELTYIPIIYHSMIP